MSTEVAPLAVGQVIGPLDVGPAAHGGHFVARHQGRVIFVRHALPAERVMVRLTEVKKNFCRADVTKVLSASADRVEPPCQVASPQSGGCGGCDFQHVRLSAQRQLKSAVLAEQLSRLAGLDRAVEVEAVDDSDGLGWRTRVRYRLDRGRPALLAHRSHTPVQLPEGGCLIASAEPTWGELTSAARRVGGTADELTVVSAEPVTMLADRRLVSGAEVVTHHVLGRAYRVAASGFWQVHPRAAEVLTQTVLDWLRVEPGERALDLYCGVGLFAGALVDAGAEVTGVEISRGAIAQARDNVPEATFIAGDLERSLSRLPGGVDLVVLDPPRAGAGRKVIAHVAGLGARAIVHIGCDPASFARDLADFAAHGYQVDELRAFDLFPMTHHFESIALLTKSESDLR